MIKTLLTLMLLLLLAAKIQAQEANPISWSLYLERPSKTVKQGETISVFLTAKIKKEWKLYAPDQGRTGPQLMRISVLNSKAFTQAGIIKAPRPKQNYDSNFGTTTKYYEEAVTITLPVKVFVNAPLRKQKLQVQISFRFCNASQCYPTKKINLETMIDVKPTSGNSRKNAE